MGTCFSSSSCLCSASQQIPPPTAKVLSINGDLHEYIPPVSVSQVLQAETTTTSSSSSSSSNYFLCNCDLLSYDEFIPSLDSHAPLHPNQLYFVLPISKLHSRLTAPDMAALAVRASVGLQRASQSDRGRNKARISPLLFVNNIHHEDYDNPSLLLSQKPKAQPQTQPQPQPRVGFSRSGSVRRLQKYASRRAKLAVRSFKLRLATIDEGTVI